VRATTADNIPVDALKSLEIPLPPLPEQRRIAAILDKADALRFQRVISIKRLGSAVDAVFVKEFGDPIANPRNYAVHPLGELCDVRDGTHDSPGYVAEGFPLVTSKNLTAGRVDLTDASLISEEDYVAINRRSKVDRGDILMPMIGTVGNPVIIDHDPGYAVKNVAIIKFLTTSPSNVFVHALMNGPYFDHVTSRNNRGGTQKFVSLGDLRAFPVPLPSRDEQGHFDDRVKGINVLRTSMTASLQVLSKLFCSLQQRAFDGEL
jgi:type I restriction enzyme S subunit